MISIELYPQRIGNFNFNKPLLKKSLCNIDKPSNRKGFTLKILLIFLMLLQNNIKSNVVGHSGSTRYFNRQSYSNRNFKAEY